MVWWPEASLSKWVGAETRRMSGISPVPGCPAWRDQGISAGQYDEGRGMVTWRSQKGRGQSLQGLVSHAQHFGFYRKPKKPSRSGITRFVCLKGYFGSHEDNQMGKQEWRRPSEEAQWTREVVSNSAPCPVGWDRMWRRRKREGWGWLLGFWRSEYGLTEVLSMISERSFQYKWGTQMVTTLRKVGRMLTEL